nr:sigma-70 family RNA polymerase sigma factor [Deinobacterium chartae]
MIHRVGQGDEEALRILYGQLGPAVQALALRMLGSREEAEEVLQDTFVRLHARAVGYRSDFGSARAFVYTIARNEALSRLRSRQARPRHADGWDVHEPDVPLSAPAADPLDRLLVERALERLGPPDDHLLRAAFFQGHSHAELARHSGLPLGTVKTRLRRALLRLQALLGDV